MNICSVKLLRQDKMGSFARLAPIISEIEALDAERAGLLEQLKTLLQ